MIDSSTLSGSPSPILFPQTLTIGDTWTFSMSAGEYSTSDWSATITFASGTTRVSSVATMQSAVFYFVIAPAQTSTLPAGSVAYAVSMASSLTLDRFTLQEGVVKTLPDLTDPSAVIPTQTMLQQQLAACDATLLKLLSQRTSSVVFGGKAYTLWDISKLWAVRNDLYQRVQDEAAAMDTNSRQQIIIPVFKNPWGGPYPSQPYYPYS